MAHASTRRVNWSACRRERFSAGSGIPDGDDRRCGPRQRARNALTMREETQVLALMTSAEYGHLSPKQLVPRLADEGRYLASESTMYRLKRRVGLGAHRPVMRLTEVTRATTVHRAVRANQVWSWDITYLPTVIRGRFLRLYLVDRCLEPPYRRLGDPHRGERRASGAAHSAHLRGSGHRSRPAWCCTRTTGNRCAGAR